MNELGGEFAVLHTGDTQSNNNYNDIFYAYFKYTTHLTANSNVLKLIVIISINNHYRMTQNKYITILFFIMTILYKSLKLISIVLYILTTYDGFNGKCFVYKVHTIVYEKKKSICGIFIIFPKTLGLLKLKLIFREPQYFHNYLFMYSITLT